MSAVHAVSSWNTTTTYARHGENAAGGFEAEVQATRASSRIDQSGSALPQASKDAHRMQKSRQDFEAFFLQVMLGAMMPNETDKMFGPGSAGKIWRSMLSEQLARQISSSGRLQILPDRTRAATGSAQTATAAGETHSTVAGWQVQVSREGSHEPVSPASWAVNIMREPTHGL